MSYMVLHVFFFLQRDCSTPHTAFSWGGSYHAFDEAGARFTCCPACGSVWHPSQ